MKNLIQVRFSDEVITEFVEATSDYDRELSCWADADAAIQFVKDRFLDFSRQEETETERFGEASIVETEDRIVLTLPVYYREKIYNRYVEIREIDGKMFTHEHSESRLGDWPSEFKTVVYSAELEESDAVLMDADG